MRVVRILSLAALCLPMFVEHIQQPTRPIMSNCSRRVNATRRKLAIRSCLRHRPTCLK
ncbi:hypothetical protein PR003_g15554 [Phytophthora rubi]|uniref:RxLR effector protein n=1 Tax=Phytophthora rubi TaxID=129364 RepID=A0A6A3MZV9_9STRA|nr:hypothetical protein PR002_g8633 [Phytophthora rubi]KAE9037381.1 hypothetical protein PR001_g8400 [Phytophthora rubi]KAE9329446.1 hypothetical protein PR003_g15554 [Phytophthora rubi]